MGTVTVATTYKRSGNSIVRAPFLGDLKIVPFTFTASTSYATNGDTVAAADMPIPAGMTLVNPWAINAPRGYAIQLDTANNKLIFWSGATAAGTHAEVTNAVNLQTTGQLGTGTHTVFFICR